MFTIVYKLQVIAKTILFSFEIVFFFQMGFFSLLCCSYHLFYGTIYYHESIFLLESTYIYILLIYLLIYWYIYWFIYFVFIYSFIVCLHVLFRVLCWTSLLCFSLKVFLKKHQVNVCARDRCLVQSSRGRSMA